MLIAPYPTNEAARLEFLRSLDVLDTASDKQWFKSKVGLDACETSRDIAFYADGALIVEDATADVRFHYNPLVTGAPFIRFYAGIPLCSSEGFVVGTLCAIDTRPRSVNPSALAAMKDLARGVERELFHRSMSGQARTIYEDERRARSLSETRFATVFQETPTANLARYIHTRRAKRCCRWVFRHVPRRDSTKAQRENAYRQGPARPSDGLA